MSGLASFFRTFLPPKDDGKENYEYNESIANVVDKNHVPPAESPPEDPRNHSATDWKEKRNQSLSQYMTKRMIELENDDELSDENSDYIVPDNDEVNVPYWNEQQGQDSRPTDDSNDAVLPASLRRKRVPHVNETVHIAKTLGALDLYAREFHLSLGFVEHVWPLRAVPRREWKISSNFEDDGPLGTLFKQVVSLEVTALADNTVANMAQAAFQDGAHTPKRLKIFFYNKYAVQLSEFLERQHAERVLISLENIPAKCILPLNKDDFSWLDHDGLAPYCLCIGSRSSMRLDQDGVMKKIAFDAPDLKVTIARLSKDKEVDEVDVTPESIKQDLELKETDSLEAAYQEWQQNQEKEAKDDQDEEEDQEQASGADAGTTRRADTANDGRSKKKARTENTYHTLSEMRGLYEARKGGGQFMVNVFATVLGFSSPSLTKGYDWMMNVTLVDESLPLPETGNDANDDPVAAISCVIFCRDREALPKLRRAGDVLRIHRVALQEWKGDIQLMGRRASSFVIVRPEDTASTGPQDAWEIVKTAQGSITFDQSDRERSMALWKWAQTRLADYPTMHKASEKLTISDLARQDQSTVTEDTFGDLTLIVSAILPVPQALRVTASPLGWLRVWDGTGPPESDALPVASAGAPEAIKNGDPPSEALQAIASAIECIKSQDDGDAASYLEPPKCLCGRVTNLAVWEETHWDLVMDTLKVGSFIRLRNAHQGTTGQGLRCLMISTKSALTPLPNDTYEIKKLLENHQQRLARKDPYNPQSGVLPLDGESAAVAGTEPDEGAPMDMDDGDTPMDIEQDGFASIALCISEAAPSSFKVKFHITGTVPCAIEGHHKLRCLCSNRASGSGVVYQFAVNVNDETAAIDALVSNEVGEDLFQLDATAAASVSTSEASAIMKEVTSEDKLWKGQIKSFELNGSRYFILDSVSAVSE